VVKPSPERKVPDCPAFPDCGGCQLLHLSYQGQLAWKQKYVTETLKRVGKLENLKILPIISMDNPLEYRNKAQYPIAKEASGNLLIGYFRPKTHEVVPLDGCMVQPPLIQKAFQVAKEVLNQAGIEAYDEVSHTGVLRHLLIRNSFAYNQLLITLVTNGSGLPNKDFVIDKLQSNLPELTGIVQNINSTKGNVILGDKCVTLWGKDRIKEKLLGLDFYISSSSFFQVNPQQTEKLYTVVKEYLSPTGGEVVLDAYCGTGTISLIVAKEVKEVIGIEVVSSAVDNARENAELNHITNTAFVLGEVQSVLPEMTNYKSIDAVILDPPRSGCEKVVFESIAQAGIGKIIYVSCNPASLARDLRILGENGYEILQIQPVDMFPQTSHVETVVLITRAKE
jgi:23S rRNA (uracil1939-C5)-methyltransferase